MFLSGQRLAAIRTSPLGHRLPVIFVPVGAPSLGQFAVHPDCGTLFPRIEQYFLETLDSLRADRAIDPDSVMPDISNRLPSDADLMNAFMQTLTDPCVLDCACIARWIPDPSNAPDEHQLNAVDVQRNPL